MKMKQVYESNPALGDPMSIQGQLTENGHKLDKLRAELKKFQVGIYLFFTFKSFNRFFSSLGIKNQIPSLSKNDTSSYFG